METSNTFPFMEMPKRKLEVSAFYKKCNDLIDSIDKIHEFFTWFGEKTKNDHDKLRSIVFLEGLFLEMLVLIRDIFMMRGRKLYDEHTDKFKDALKKLNKKMPLGTRFILRSNKTLEADLKNKPSCAASMRQDIVEGFRELAEWLREETKNQKNREQAGMLVDALELNYDMDMFGCIGDNFEQHANMVLNGLMLLAWPAVEKASPDVYREMFDNTIAELQNEPLWELTFSEWKEEVAITCDQPGYMKDEGKLDFLKRFWKALNDHEKDLLTHRYEIGHNPARSDSNRATMGLRIYENLNGDTKARIDIADLRQYLLCVVQKKYIGGEIEKLRPQPRMEMPKPTANKKRPPLWKSEVNLSALASCFNDVYCRFFGGGEKQEHLQGKHNDEVTLMAFLYIICKKNDYFKNEEKLAFFKFCKEEVGFTTDMSDKTFRNRLSKVEDKLHSHPLLGVDKTTDGNFQRIRRIFHGTKKYESIKPLKKD